MKKFHVSLGVLPAVCLLLPAGAMAQDQHQPHIGPVQSLQDLQDTGKVLFKLADDNNDGQISQAEANDVGNLMVGGYFFRADTNGDGAISEDEARAAREHLYKERPWLRYVVETAKSAGAQQNQSTNPGGANPDAIATVMAVFDTNGDKKLQATELRQGVRSTVDGAFAIADTNRDGQLSPTEINAAMMGTAKSIADAAFKDVDTDNNGSISEEEFNKALLKPAHVAFAVMDLNHDGQISREEAQKGRRVIINNIKGLAVPEPANSPANLLRSGRSPSDVAPVPNVDLRNLKPNQNNQTQPSQPPAAGQPPAATQPRS
jgi:Ca2+-binding EF-hand superfamily protein